MKIIFLAYFVISCLTCSGQSSQSNCWFLIQSSVENKAQLHNMELGHRRQEQFLKQHRQSFFRYTFSYKLQSKKGDIGGGIAYFLHEKSGGNSESEIRPFLQVVRTFSFGKQQLQWRFRNEFRFFDRTTGDQNRLRLQLQFSRLLHARFQTRILYFNELFYICGNLTPWEWRTGVAIQQTLSGNWKVGLGYSYQNNQNSRIRNVHIVQLSILHKLLLKQ